MEPRTEMPIAVLRRRERDGLVVDDRRLARAVRAGRMTRIAAGSFVASPEWKLLTPMKRHLARVIETVDRARGPLVLTHHAAAAVHGLDRIGRWPETVDVRIPRASGGRSSGAIRRRALGLEGVELMEWRGHLVTSPAQTAIDVASESDFLSGVVAVDQALWTRREGGALAEIDQLEQVLVDGWRRGMRRVRPVLAFGTGQADSVRESEGRVLIERLGFPSPTLQKEFVLPGGSLVRTDYYWEEFDHIGEFDGIGKYFDPELLRGRTPEEVLLAEKDRGDALRRQVKALSRWRTPAHRDPRLLYDILVVDGLPSRLPPPRSRPRR